jgi:hypothetical protein
LSTAHRTGSLEALTDNRLQQLINLPRGNIMTKLLTALLAAMFATVTLAPVAFAQEKKKESPLAAACKGKKPGDVVKVDGKDAKCPAPKAAAKK